MLAAAGRVRAVSHSSPFVPYGVSLRVPHVRGLAQCVCVCVCAIAGYKASLAGHITLRFRGQDDDFNNISTTEHGQTHSFQPTVCLSAIGSKISISMAAASSETAAERRPTPPTLSEVLRPLNDIPQDQRAFGARQLLMACCHLEETQKRLQSRPAPDVETLADQDRWVASTRASECAVLGCRPGSVGCIWRESSSVLYRAHDHSGCMDTE